MNQVEAGRVHRSFCMERTISQERDVIHGANLLRKAERLGCESLEWQRALRVSGESGSVVVVAAHGYCSVPLHPLDGFVGSWPIVHQIA
jgi:hypothetical protein